MNRATSYTRQNLDREAKLLRAGLRRMLGGQSWKFDGWYLEVRNNTAPRLWVYGVRIADDGSTTTHQASVLL